MSRTHAQCVAELQTLRAAMGVIADGQTVTDEQHAEFGRLAERFETIDGERLSLERAALMARMHRGEVSIERGAFGGMPSPAQHRGEAHRVVDAAVQARTLDDAGAEHVTRMLDSGPPRERTLAAQWMRVTGSPEYLSAFARIVSDPERGHMLWTPEEQHAYRAAEEWRAATIASDAGGGYLVPAVVDLTVLNLGPGIASPLRTVARQETILSNEWQGVTSAGVQSHWRATEGVEMEDDTPAFASPIIPCFRLDSFIPFSRELGEDAPGLVVTLAEMMKESAEEKIQQAATTGTGTGEPTGFISALVAAGGASVVTPTVAETFSGADLYKIQNSLPPRHQPGAAWMASLAVINQIAGMETAAGALRFPGVATGTLLQKPLYELSTLDSTWDVTATAENYVLAYGDWRNLIMVTRVPSVVEVIPNLFGPARRFPTGQRGAMLWSRAGSDVVNDNGLRVFNLHTTTP